jgi:hypothetical protein
MVKNRKRKALVDTEFAVHLLSEEVKVGQLRSNPAKVCSSSLLLPVHDQLCVPSSAIQYVSVLKLDDDDLFIEDTQPDDAQIALPVRRKRLRASKEKRMTRAQAIIAATNPLPLATGGAYAKRKKRAAAKTVSLPSGCRPPTPVVSKAWRDYS